jgi:hypothetical protein
MSKIKEAVSDEETLTRAKGMILSRERAKSDVNALFNLAKSARKTAVSTANLLFVQAPTSQNQRPFMQKEGKVFGESKPSTLRHGEIPYKHRKADYVEYLGKKSKEKPTGTGKSVAVGGLVGAGLGAAGAALLKKNPLHGAAAGAGVGGLTGGLLGHLDKKEIAHSKKVLESGNVDKHLSKEISKSILKHEAAQAARHNGPAIVEALSGIARRSHEKDMTESRQKHERDMLEARRPKPAGTCTHCGAPAPTSGRTCSHCGKGTFTKSAGVAQNVTEFFEKRAYLTTAQRLFPELLKVGSTETQRQMPVTKRPAGATASKPIISGHQQ